MSQDLCIDILTDWRDLDSLAGAWDGLLESSSADSVFLRWDWIRQWGRLVGDDLPPYIVCARSHGRLIGIAPFYRMTYRLPAGWRVKALRIIGDLDCGAEYPDLIVDKAMEETGYAALLRALARQKKQWDFIWMPRVSGWSGAHERIQSAIAATPALALRRRPHSFSALALPQRFEDYAHALPSRRRRRRWHRRNRILRSEDVRIERCRNHDELAGYLDALFRLHGKRWQRAGLTGYFQKRPLGAAFYKAFAADALDHGWLALYGLRQGDTFRAVQIGYIYRRVFHSLQEGYDPDFLPGAGGTLRLAVIEDCIRQGLSTYDFLGDHTPHKASWLAAERWGHDLLITHDGLTSRLIGRSGVWPTGRYLRPRRPAVWGPSG